MATTTCASVQLPSLSRWTLSPGKRSMDLLASTAGLIIAFPLIAVIAALIFLSSGRPIFFRQWRLGRDGQRFELLKFRTMAANAVGNGLGVTRSDDTRITPIGRWLRKWKLDELPQLLNVLQGEMSLVGPRPDLEEFWALASAKDQAVLALIPGITGAASLAFCDEERLLSAVPQSRLIDFYIEQLLPEKARLDLDYAGGATFRSDFSMLLRTLCLPLTRRRAPEVRTR